MLRSVTVPSCTTLAAGHHRPVASKVLYPRLYSSLKATELATGYRPRDVERHHDPLQWQPDNIVDPNKPAYSFILPPPNVTGDLHLGHALMCTIQDVIARHRRRLGTHSICWIPGTDHAGIATQVVVEKQLRQTRGLTRHQLGRAAFVDEVWSWRDRKATGIRADLQRMGATADWQREYFTMDAAQSLAVRTAFVRLFDEGLVYREDQLVNWSCQLESTISDIEVDTLEVKGPTDISVPGYAKPVRFGEMTHLAYRVADTSPSGAPTEVVVATTRPETVLGDVAVAVHPDDVRYSRLRPATSDHPPTQLEHPLRPGHRIPLVFDAAVDPTFGTGAVKCTPAHDRFDLELARRHQLPTAEQVIDERGRICERYATCGFGGAMPRFEARELVRERLAEMGALRGIRPHQMQLPRCSRSGDVVELLLRPQWFVRCAGMAAAAVQAVRSGELRLQPEQFAAEWERWLSDGEARDWCVSRQLWWGHRIPAFECRPHAGATESVWLAAMDAVEARSKAAERFGQCDVDQITVRQDSDVLDTWFSSALLPFSAVGWPDTQSPDFRRYYPNRILVTGHDILFFWVARMVMLGQKLTGRLPFAEVLLHGIVCDAQGRKMSKSLGNVIRPQQVIGGATLPELWAETDAARATGALSVDEAERSKRDQARMFPQGIPECGTDALRFTLCSHNVRGHFVAFDAQECHTNKLFFNKVWQATRFTLAARVKWTASNDIDRLLDDCSASLTRMDRWALHRLTATVRAVRSAMDAHQFHVATAALRQLLYATLCDVYIETTKTVLNADVNTADRDQQLRARLHCAVLERCLSVALRELGDFAPFVCAELQTHLSAGRSIVDSANVDDRWLNPALEADTEELLQICAAIRQLQSECGIARKHQPRVHVHISGGDDKLLRLLRDHHSDDLRALSGCAAVQFSERPLADAADKLAAQSTAGAHCQFGIELPRNGDATAATAQRSQRSTVNERKLQRLELDLERLERTVTAEGFRRSASEKVQKQHGEKIERIRAELASIRQMH